MASLDIVIVNWNAGRQLRDCLESVAAADQTGFELRRVVVIDNASKDGSVDNLDDIEVPLSIVRNPENRGFGAACNQGAAGSLADYLLFLNPDMRLFKDSLSVPATFMERPENRQVGSVGIQLLDERGRVSRTCTRFPTPGRFFSKMVGLDRLFPAWFPSHFMFDWDHLESREVDHVIGAFFLVRRSVFEELSGFDERFFVYLEDLDFSFRAWQAGWRSFYLAEAQAYHKGGGTSEQIKARRLFYSLRSRILYGYKHFGHWAATGSMLGTLLLEPVARLALGAAHRSGQEMSETLKAYSLLWSDTPRLLRSHSIKS